MGEANFYYFACLKFLTDNYITIKYFTMPVAMETTKAAAETVPTIPVKKVEKSRSKSRSRSLTSFSSRSSRLNMSHNLSLSDLMNRSFGPSYFQRLRGKRSPPDFVLADPRR